MHNNDIRIDNAITILLAQLLESCKNTIESFTINSLVVSKKSTDYEKINRGALDYFLNAVCSCPMLSTVMIKGIYISSSRVKESYPEVHSRYLADVYHKTFELTKRRDYNI
ncbi:hypothetical protein DFA_01203 [Cavenderia fasciculata]|uniref:Uncharacterized protein n=1 Tax=Cavenderia fasciculata TaxID=261658 RepID=F4PRI2_CACFS|nr:uncharacterized protein DFA_01203 [Cavenderia fasciculata]EGG21322.1 hypothetical protein DFA_01203 [Cavenderia fasciculata]|eukprot:XP_004359172.1 hypothetical protein DFA_01203 [Cavenderia fasciculata]